MIERIRLMAKMFPHLKDSEFPHLDNIDVYKYANEFDYSRFDAAQMSLMMCNVPWDMGEAHIGNRTISGIGNVVYFGSTAARDAWFDAIPDTECYRFETKFKELHSTNEIDVPIPFDVASKYNYLVVRYNLFANDDSLVEYEDEYGLTEWFWFIREVEFIAPNSTKLHLLNDAWQTFIYDLDVSGMILERGHAPMAAMSASDYLANPVGNSGYLLHSDIVNDNANYLGNTAGSLVFNSGTDVYACFVTSADPAGTWGTKAAGTWETPSVALHLQDGSPSYTAFAVKAADLHAFLVSIYSSVPQFYQTVKAVFFMGSAMLTLGTSFTFGGKTCYLLASGYKTNDVLELDLDDFGYGDAYREVAKLYTYPYAYIELSDGNGDITQLRIESTNGTVEFVSKINLLMPFIRITGHVESSGRGSEQTIVFKNVDSHSFKAKGDWYKLLKEWDIPTFGVILQSSKEFDYSTHFNRVQSAVAYNNGYDSTVASADTAKSNAYASAATAKTNTDAVADMGKTNADASADQATANATVQTATNTANNTANNTYLDTQTTLDNVMNTAQALHSNIMINGTVNNDIEAENQRATVTAGSAAANGAVSAITNLLSGNIPGAVGAAVGAGTTAATALANATISANLATAQAELQKTYNSDNSIETNTLNTSKKGAQKTNALAIVTNNNTMTTTLAANMSALTKANATRTQSTTKANATRDKNTAEANADRDNTTAKANAGRTKDTAQKAVENQVKQAALQAPYEFGSISNAESANTRPLGLFASVVRQDDYSIGYAGDYFLRYGYALDRAWEFDGNWNVSKCKYFAYWKLKDFWVSNLSIPDMYVDKIRFFLFGGVTVWRKPEYIGKRGIYDNIDWS